MSDAAAKSRSPRVHALNLVDRHTGEPLRISGRVLTILARDPRIAARDLMQDRDPARWSVRAAEPEIASL